MQFSTQSQTDAEMQKRKKDCEANGNTTASSGCSVLWSASAEAIIATNVPKLPQPLPAQLHGRPICVLPPRLGCFHLLKRSSHTQTGEFLALASMASLMLFQCFPVVTLEIQ